MGTRVERIKMKISSKSGLKRKMNEEDDTDPQLAKRVRGLLNRLTSTNLMSISSDFEELLKTNSYHHVNTCLSKCIEQQLVSSVCLRPQRLISENAMLIAVLHCNVGEEIGAHMLHYFLNLFEKLRENFESEKSEESKELDNIVAFLCYLCACNVAESGLIYDIIERINSPFTSKSVELLLLILKMIGFVLRRADPTKMRQMILDVQKSASCFQSEDKRVQFMLEALNAVKNNNLNKLNSVAEDALITQVDVNSLRNSLKNGIKNNKSVTSLPGKYENILASSRWWVKTDNYVEEAQKEERQKKRRDKSPSTNLDPKNEKLCSKLRLVTPLRKNLFKAIVTCEDYVECCQRLVRIGGRQFVEVVNVCLLLAQKEKQFNPFYVHLLHQLSLSDRKYKLAVIYNFRDRINDMERLKEIERNNLAQCMVELLKRNAIPITVLKTIQFGDLDRAHLEFLRQILNPILSLEEDQLVKILSKIKPKDPFAKALKLFISCFIESNSDALALWPRKSSNVFSSDDFF
ncbi:nucleolar MIF4G domain-containing protein 1 homolog [Brevipalpus obovatus]|uniref:nucleolar MIF4G domain-containing protein 1 homolog n=1 Tax=Brevipalpus obovatus TaxID=246614 RepID=UPI003D9F03F7